MNTGFCSQITSLFKEDRKNLLQLIATEYGLDYKELSDKFMEGGNSLTKDAPPKQKTKKAKDAKQIKKRHSNSSCSKCCARVWGEGFPQCTRKCKTLTDGGKTCDRFCKTHFKFWLQGGDKNLPHGVVLREPANVHEEGGEKVEQEEKKVEEKNEKVEEKNDKEDNEVEELEVIIAEELGDNQLKNTPVKKSVKEKTPPPAPKKRGRPKKKKDVEVPLVPELEKEEVEGIPEIDEGNESEDDEGEEVACKEFEYDGDVYLLDPACNKLYQRTGDNDFVGKLVNGAIDFDAEDSDAESDDEE